MSYNNDYVKFGERAKKPRGAGKGPQSTLHIVIDLPPNVHYSSNCHLYCSINKQLSFPIGEGELWLACRGR